MRWHHLQPHDSAPRARAAAARLRGVSRRLAAATVALGWGCGGDAPGDPTCFVDFPCGLANRVAGCRSEGELQRYRTVPCEEVCGNEPCSGAGCEPAAIEACPGDAVCVEPVRAHAECRPKAATCGGPEHRTCAADEHCVYRASNAPTPSECEVVEQPFYGVCLPVADGSRLRCSADGLPTPANPLCPPLCERAACAPGDVAACVAACDTRLASEHSLCAACLVDGATPDTCATDAGPSDADGIPGWPTEACAPICAATLAGPYFTPAQADDLRCVTLCETARCPGASAEACLTDCAARLHDTSALCGLCLVETAAPGDCGAGPGLPRHDSAGCLDVCTAHIGAPSVDGGGGPVARCDGLCTHAGCDDKLCANDCGARSDGVSTLCANCLVDHASTAACAAGTSPYADFDLAPCLDVCTHDVVGYDAAQIAEDDPRCIAACDAAVCADRKWRCVADCSARVMLMGATCAACVVASLEGFPDCSWRFRPDACAAACPVAE